MEENVSVAQEDIRVAYKDLKVIEITSEKIQKVLEAEKEKSDQSVLDEMGQENYRRLKMYHSI